MNNDLLIYLIKFLHSDDLINYVIVFPNLSRYVKKEIKRRLVGSFNLKIRNILGTENLMKAKLLNFKKKFIRYRFLDNIALEDLSDKDRIFIGRDSLDRCFAVLKYDKKSIFIIYHNIFYNNRVSAVYKEFTNENIKYYIASNEDSFVYKEIEKFWKNI